MADTVRFILDGKVVETGTVAPTTTMLQFLRDTLGRTGTKEGCAEGDCGACTVLEGELCDGSMHYQAVNSCIRFVPTFDGKEVVTVESLKQPDGSLHPVQQAMVDCHASQCGFCTPGFVMSLCGLYLDQAQEASPCESHSREQVLDAISGNLCRCTGYRPIIDAALSLPSFPVPVKWSCADAQNPARAQKLQSIQHSDSLRLNTGAGFAAPQTLDELATLYAEKPQALLLAGGTDIGLWVTKHMRALPYLIYLGKVAELGTIDIADGVLRIGAAVPLSRAYCKLLEYYPSLDELARRFASVPIRNSGTFCGNVANGSPIGDSMPVLLALGAQLELRHGAVTRLLALDEFYLGYQKKAWEPGEFVAAVRIPQHVDTPEIRHVVASYKISKRFEQDISAVCGGYALTLEAGIITSARIAYGGMAATSKRASHVEAALLGKAWQEETFESARQVLGQDYQPIGDMRASAAYRLEVAGNLLKRLWLEGMAPAGTQAAYPLSIPSDLDALV